VDELSHIISVIQNSIDANAVVVCHQATIVSKYMNDF